MYCNKYIRFADNTFCDCSNQNLITRSRLRSPYSIVDTGIFNLHNNGECLSFRGIVIQRQKRYGDIYNCRYTVKFPDYINKVMRTIEFDSGFYLSANFIKTQYVHMYLDNNTIKSRVSAKSGIEVHQIKGMFHPKETGYNFMNFGMTNHSFDVVVGTSVLSDIKVLFQGNWGILFSKELLPLSLVTFKNWNSGVIVVDKVLYVMNMRFTLGLFKSRT